MIKYLIKNTAEIRVESEEDANELHKEFEHFAHDNNYILNSWTQNYHKKTSGGEIVSEWWICKVVIIFNDAKDPFIPLKDINFEMQKTISFEVQKTVSIDNVAPWDGV